MEFCQKVYHCCVPFASASKNGTPPLNTAWGLHPYGLNRGEDALEVGEIDLVVAPTLDLWPADGEVLRLNSPHG